MKVEFSEILKNRKPITDEFELYKNQMRLKYTQQATKESANQLIAFADLQAELTWSVYK